MVSKNAAWLVLFLFFFSIGKAWGHHPSGGAGISQAGTVRTISANPLPKGKWTFSLQTEFIEFDAFSDHELARFAEQENHVHSVDDVFHTVFGAGYGVSDDFTISLKIPYEYLNNIREAHHDEPEEIHNRGDSQGIGDMTILGYYRFLNMPSHEFSSSLLFGLKVPTGITDEEDREGERFETEFQPGTGAWSPMAGIACTKLIGRFSLETDLLYTAATEGAQDTNMGDMFNYNAAFSYRALQDALLSIDLILEVNGEWREKQKIDGRRDENSCGNTISLSPGIRVFWSRNWSGYLSAGFPVVQDLNGEQTDTEISAIAGINAAF